MKTIELKKLPIKNPDGSDGVLDYKSELILIMHAPQDPQRGAGIDEIRKSIRVLDALERAQAILELEDADHDFLRGRMNTARFGVIIPEIVQFVDDITKAGE